MTRKALIVVTNTAKFGSLNRATGLWFSEAAHFNNAMDDNGIEVDYVSPAGGYVPVDPASLASDAIDAGCWKYYGSADFRDRILGRSLTPAGVNPADYDCIYFAGGHGVLWDFPQDAQLGAIAQAIAANGGVVAAVCHGVVGLLAVKNADGTPFIQGRNVTGFSNAEEKINGLLDKVPFSTEDALKGQGGLYTCGKPYTDHVVTDGNLITGQNPQSAHSVGEAVVAYLSKK